MMKVVVDFNGYDSCGSYHIKEVSIYRFTSIGHEKILAHQILESTPNHLNHADVTTQINYRKYYEAYGIPWGTGRSSSKDFRKVIKILIEANATVFIETTMKYILFRNYLTKFLNINSSLPLTFVILHNLGYLDNSLTSACVYHSNTELISCADSTASSMAQFVRLNRLFVDSRLNEVHIVLDLSSFGLSDFKELAISRFNYDGAFRKLESYVAKPRIKYPTTDWRASGHYGNNGILWSEGDLTFREAKVKLVAAVTSGLFIYVESLRQKDFLCRMIGDVSDKIICLDELNYVPGMESLSKCSWHDGAENYNCAVVNVQRMSAWLRHMRFFNVPRRIALGRSQPSVKIYRDLTWDDAYSIHSTSYSVRDISEAQASSSRSSRKISDRNFEGLHDFKKVKRLRKDSKSSEPSTSYDKSTRLEKERKKQDDSTNQTESNPGGSQLAQTTSAANYYQNFASNLFDEFDVNSAATQPAQNSSHIEISDESDQDSNASGSNPAEHVKVIDFSEVLDYEYDFQD